MPVLLDSFASFSACCFVIHTVVRFMLGVWSNYIHLSREESGDPHLLGDCLDLLAVASADLRTHADVIFYFFPNGVLPNL